MEIELLKGGDVLQADSADYFLGQSEDRYFSSNYKKVEHLQENLRIQDETLYGYTVIKWPDTWARKKGKVIKPHAGTLDFFVIAVQFVELYYSLIETAEKMEQMWISDFICSSGATFIEDERISCSCRQQSRRMDGNRLIASFEIKIADAAVQLIIENRITREADRLPETDSERIISFHREGYKYYHREISNILWNKTDKHITADYNLIAEDIYAVGGIGSFYMPCLTFCDLILVSGQLSQILAFGLDDITREEASCLFLRKIHGKYVKPVSGKTSVNVSVVHSDILKMRNETYRGVHLFFDFNNGDLTANCKAAYKINIS
jgi:hypothetical protein